MTHQMKETRELTVKSIVLLFGCLFLYTAVSKIVSHGDFVLALAMSPYIDGKAELVGLAIPIIELLIVALLMFEKFRRKGLIASLVLVAAFTIYLIYMVATVDKLPCTCAGVISEMTWRQHIGFNILLMCVATVGIRLSNFKNI